MNQTFPFLIAIVICSFVCIKALECGFDRAGDRKLKDVMKKCATKEDDESAESSEHLKTDTKRKGGKRSVKTKDEKQDKNETECLLHCIYKNFDAVNKKGYPDEDLVRDVLINYTNGKESKKFFEESIEDCFQLLKKGKDLDSCEYSTQLTTCLAEKGRNECTDWDESSLPFNV